MKKYFVFVFLCLFFGGCKVDWNSPENQVIIKPINIEYKTGSWNENDCTIITTETHIYVVRGWHSTPKNSSIILCKNPFGQWIFMGVK